MPVHQPMNASPASLAQVFGNGKRYAVPIFQRDYAWGEDEWSELWADLVDLIAARDATSYHYLGALVLQPADRAELHIIDGQQRLVTLSILALAVIGRIERLIAAGVEPDDNRERARLLRERFVSTRDSASLQHHSRLRLNARDDGFYRTYLLQNLTPTRPGLLRGSEARLYGALTSSTGRSGSFSAVERPAPPSRRSSSRPSPSACSSSRSWFRTTRRRSPCSRP